MPLTIEQQRAIAVAQAKRKRAEAEGQGPKPQASAQPSLRSETDAIIEEAAANIPGGFAAFDAKPADPARMKAMGYVQDPLAKSGYAKPRAPEAPMADTGKTDSPFADVMRGLEAPIVGLTGGGLEGWGRTMQADPVRGASEAVDFISPVDDLGRAYQGVKQAGAGLIEGDMGKAAEGAQQASIQGSYAAMQMLPGSMTLKGVTGRAAPTTMAGAERAAVQASRAPQVMKPQAKPEPVLTPPSEAPKPFSAPPEPIGRGVVRRNLDRIIGGSVGATLGGTGDAMAAPGDGDSGGLPGGAATGAAIGIFGPRAIAAASSRGFRAAARGITPKGNRAAFDERVASRAVRKALVSGGINSEQDALNAARAKFGDKQASVSVSDLTQDGVSLTTGVSRLPGSTGELARARAEDLIENRSGRLARDVEQSTGFSTAAVSGDIDQMAKEAMEKATPEYEALRAQYPQGSLNSPRLTQIEGIGQHTKAVDDYRTATKANEGREVGDFEYWDLVKRDIDAKEQQLIDSGATMDDIRLRKLESARAALVKELDDLMPDYAAARQLGGEAPKIRGAFKEGQTYIGGRFSADEVAAKISEYTGAPLTAAQAGAIRTILGKTEGAGAAVAALRSPRAKKQLEAVFGKTKADEIQARFAADATLVQNASRTNPNVGSVTSQAGMGGGGGAVQNIAEMAQTGLRMGASPIQTALAAISKSGSYTKAQRDLMGQMLLEGVTPENVARIFAGKKPKGGTAPPAGPTTGLGGPARSGMSGKAEAIGALGGTGLGFATAPDQNGDGTVDAQERMMGAAGGAISGVLGVKGLGAASGLAAKAMKGAKPKGAPAKPAFDQRFMKEAQQLVSYNGGVDKAVKAQQYVIDQLVKNNASQDRINKAVSVRSAIERMAERSSRELDEIVPMADAPPTGPKPIDPSTNYNIDPRGDKFIIRTDAGEQVLGAPEFSDRKQALAWLQGETRKARQGRADPIPGERPKKPRPPPVMNGFGGGGVSMRSYAQSTPDELDDWYKSEVEQVSKTSTKTTLRLKSSPETQEGTLRKLNDVHINFENDGVGLAVDMTFRGGHSAAKYTANSKDVAAATRVFAKTLAAINVYVRKNNPTYITFYGATPAHTKLYQKLMERANIKGYTPIVDTGSSSFMNKSAATGDVIGSTTPRVFERFMLIKDEELARFKKERPSAVTSFAYQSVGADGAPVIAVSKNYADRRPVR